MSKIQILNLAQLVSHHFLSISQPKRGYAKQYWLYPGIVEKKCPKLWHRWLAINEDLDKMNKTSGIIRNIWMCKEADGCQKS